MEILNCGDHYWAGRIRVEESRSIPPEGWKELFSLKNLSAVLEALKTKIPGIDQYNWRELLESRRRFLDGLAASRLGEKALKLLKREDWQRLTEVYASGRISGFFKRLASCRSYEKTAERNILKEVWDTYPDNWGRIEGDEMFFLFYIYKTAELRLLWLLLLSMEKKVPVQVLSEELL